MKKSIYIYLTGGLGNQLFQLSAALSALKGQSGTIFIDPYLGAPRVTQNKADILHLALPDNVVVLDRPASLFMQKTCGYLLRHGIYPNKLERVSYFRNLIRFSGRLFLACRFRRWLKLVIADDVGYVDFSIARNSLLIGYFQTHCFIENIWDTGVLEQLAPSEESPKLTLLIEKAILEKPIFLHIRLTDYLSESNFGNLGREYYRSCIDFLNGSHRKIWVFTDDISLAKERLLEGEGAQFYFVDDRGLTPAQIWHLLRHGSDYIIANSSFSWWGAMARFDRTSRVVAPSPWFSAMKEPNELIPPSWKRERSDF